MLSRAKFNLFQSALAQITKSLEEVQRAKQRIDDCRKIHEGKPTMDSGRHLQEACAAQSAVLTQLQAAYAQWDQAVDLAEDDPDHFGLCSLPPRTTDPGFQPDAIALSVA